jgi:hypothetical protein
MSQTSRSLPTHLLDQHAYGDARVSFAVDVSGSTAGSILRAERSFVERCASLLSEDAREKALILPWNHGAQTPKSIHRLGTLTSGGYTIPGAIIDDSVCRAALKASSLWFLLTDGLIDEEHRLRFAELVSQQGLHGTSCITAIFGSAGQGGPSSCNISVGISVFAVVPNCVFLFNDTSSGEIYILQCKGIFNSLLMGHQNPTIDDDTLWSDLPRLSLTQLGRLIVPPPKQLSSDEVALQDDLVINFEALWADKLSKDQVSSILDNDDSLKTVMHTAQTRGQSQMFQTWVQKQEIKVEDPLYQARTDMRGSAAAVFKRVISLLQKGESSANPQLKQLQASLRMAYSSNMSALLGTARKSQQDSALRTSRITSSSSRASSDIHSAQSLSPVPVYPSAPETKSPTHSLAPSARMASQPPSYTLQRYLTSYVPPESGKWESSGLLYTPGFRRTLSNTSFSGSCSICGSDSSVLAWLFHSPPANLSTQGFPAPNSASMLAFPLAMGNFPEMDVLSSTICCEACSTFCAMYRTSPKSECITAALPMVSYQANSAAWQNVVFRCFDSRFAKEHLAQLFLAVILTAPEMMTSDPIPRDNATQLFQNAAAWATTNILTESTAVMDFSASFSQPAPGLTISRELSAVLAENFKRVNEPRAPLLLYPLEGFKIIFRAIEVGDPTGAIIALKTRQLVMYRRLLLLLVEQYAQGRGVSSMSVDDPQDPSQFLSTLLWTHERPSRDKMGRLSGDSSPEMDEDEDFVLAEAPPVQPQQQQHQEPEWAISSGCASSIPSPRCSIFISQLRNSPLLPDSLYTILSQIKEFCQLEETHFSSPYGPSTALFLHAIDRVAGGHPGNAVDANDLFEKVINLPALAVLSFDPTKVTEQMVMQQFDGKK